MKDETRKRLAVVTSNGELTRTKERASLRNDETPLSSDLDWTILMARAQDGDTVAYLRLLQEIVPYLRSLVRRWHKDLWDIEDTVQDILLTLHSIRHTYDPSRPFAPWLVGIAHRRAIDRLRLRGRQIRRETPLEAEHEAAPTTPNQADDMLERREMIAAIKRLSPIQRQAVDLLKLKEMSLKEASDVTGLSVASLKMATFRALRSLRDMLSDRKES